MDKQIDGQPTKSFWDRHRVALLVGAVGLIGLCTAAICLFLFLPTSTVTPARQMIAQQALKNPASAALHVGHYGDITGWSSPGPGDYAVQDGMVIFPESASRIPLFSFTMTLGDRKTPVLVYAPNGGDLTARPGPPADRTWFYGNEWYLYDCSPVANLPLWWGCTLLIGSNI